MYTCLFICSFDYLFLYVNVYVYIIYSQLCTTYSYIAKHIVVIHLEWTTHENTVLLWSPVSFGRTPQDLLPQQPIAARKALESRRPKCIKRVFPTTEKPTLATANHSCQAQVSSGTFYHLLHLFAMSSWSLLTLPLSWRSVEEPSWKPMEMFGKSATESVCGVIMLASLSCSKLIPLRLDILAHVVKTSLVGIRYTCEDEKSLYRCDDPPWLKVLEPMMTWFAKHTVERLSCVVVWYEACPRSKVVGQFRPGRFGVPMSPPVLGAMVLPARSRAKGSKSQLCRLRHPRGSCWKKICFINIQ